MNNVFENCVTGIYAYLKVDAYNNLFHLGELWSLRLGTNTWTAKDNAFDNCAIYDLGSPWVNDYNAYINTSGTLQSEGTHDITLTNFTYTAGPTGNSLGNYYQLSTNLVDKGSRSATAANLGDYTVNTNQVKEGATTVEIGYHYVALTNGVPFDSDANGIPDYIENRGTQCYCELSCSPPSVILLTPTNTQFFAQSPTNIVLTAQASDSDGTILHVDYFNGSTQIGTAYNPTNNQSLVGPLSIVLKAWATDNDGISSVQFYTNGILLGSGALSGTTNYFYTNTFNPGRLSVYAKATDTKGGLRLSGLVDFTVNSTNDFPLISINSPTNGASLKAWSDLTILAGASDASGITNVDFFAGTNYLGSDTNATSGTNYTVSVRGIKPGKYVLTAKATDKSNPPGRNLSAPVTVTVNKPEPTGNGHWDAVFGNNANQTYPKLLSTAVDANGVILAGGDTGNQSGITGLLNQWKACAWSALRYQTGGSTRVWCLEPYGTDLYLSGNLLGEGLLDTNVVRWDGTNWFAVGNGLGFPDPNIADGVRVVRVIKGDVYVAGDFTSAGGDATIQYISKLTLGSSSWTKVGNGLNGKVRAIANIGDTLYVGGDFTSAAGNSNIKYLARWSGTTWTNVGIGVDSIVRTLTVQGTDLFVGGSFTNAGGLTNVGCIAKWDGTAWSAIGGGVSGGISDGGLDDTVPTVDALVVRGNELYAGGEFTNAWNGANAIVVNYVAKATWDADSHNWTWSALDSGIGSTNTSASGQQVIRVRSLAIRERGNTNGYDLIVAGRFDQAGNLHSQHTARWVVGPSDCPTAGPTISITTPANYASLTQGTIYITANATTTSGSISNVQLIVDGTYLTDAVSDGTPSNYTNSWSNPSVGPHTLIAVAQDTLARNAASAPASVTIKAASGPNLTNDIFTVFSDGPATNLNVLANDYTTNGPLRIVGVSKLFNPFSTARLGVAKIGYGATNLVYQARPNTFGVEVLDYSAADGSGTNFTYAVVNIRALPNVTISFPTNGAPYTNLPVNLTVTGTSKDYDGTISNVTLYFNGVSNSIVTTTNAFSFGWTNSTPGFYSFVAVARDNDGFTNSSAPVNIVIDPPGGSPPFAKIVNLSNDTTNFTTLTITNYPVIRDGLFALIGSAYDTDGDAITRQVLLFRPGETNAYANVTAGTLDYSGFTSGSVSNASLGTLNLSAFPNGVYDMVLVVRSRGDQVLDVVRFALDNQLKIGAFSFSEQDLVIPVNGIPLTVIRTYNSLNQVNADFGYNWTYALNDMDVTIDEDRETAMAFERLDNNGYDATTEYFSLRTGGGRNVALTLPGGQRTTFVFKPVNRITYFTAEWQSAPGITAKLTMLGTNQINFFGGAEFLTPFFAAGESRTPFEAFDIEAYKLTMKDGTIYELHRDPALAGAPWTSWDYGEGTGDYRPVKPYSGKPKLTLITQPTQDKIVITNTGIHHQNTTNGVTRSVWFDRDVQNRIIAIHDPISGSNGVPAVKYVYNEDTGNLIQVLRLVDRSLSSYTTNVYHYDHPNFPHYITEIDDARGIPAARNLYDDSGRLIGMIDADGRTNSITHDLTGRTEQIVDRLGVARLTLAWS